MDKAAEVTVGAKRTFDRIYLVLLTLGFVFLPFTRALTVDVGYPLKLYEPLFAAALLTYLVTGARLEHDFSRKFLAPLLAFLISATSSYLVAAYSDTGYSFGFRGGVRVDGAFRLVYLLLNISLFVICYHAAKRGAGVLADLWLLGTAVSALYAIYCAGALTQTGEAFLLPGLEAHQVSRLGPFTVSRSGTFEEGNFAGLYFLLSAVLAFWRRRWIVLGLALAGLLISKSTSAYLAVVVVAGLYAVTNRNQKLLLLPYLVVAGLAVFGIYNYFQYEGKFSGAASSGVVRLNETMTALRMFWEQPGLGVGLGQYGFRFYEYQWDPFAPVPVSLRRIPNNIYAELLGETGAIGFSFVVIFAATWLRAARRASGRTRVFFAAGAGILVTALAYPTFNIAFLWIFLGLGLGIAQQGVDSRLRARSRSVTRGALAPSPG